MRKLDDMFKKLVAVLVFITSVILSGCQEPTGKKIFNKEF
jgi:hypothetical protein